MDARRSKPKHDKPSTTIYVPRKPNNLILTTETSNNLIHFTTFPKKLIIHSLR